MNTIMRDKIEALYGASILRKSALNIRGGAGAFEWAMAGKGYRTAVEIGTYRGCAAAEMSQYCERVVTIDLLHGKLEQNGEQWDRHAFWSSIGVTNVEFFAVGGDIDKARLLRSLDFDFAFIDGAHDRSVAGDFKMVKKCGNVLFHDADDNRLRADKPHASNHVFEFIDRLPKDQMQFHDIFALWTRA